MEMTERESKDITVATKMGYVIKSEQKLEKSKPKFKRRERSCIAIIELILENVFIHI